MLSPPPSTIHFYIFVFATTEKVSLVTYSRLVGSMSMWLPYQRYLSD